MLATAAVCGVLVGIAFFFVLPRSERRKEGTKRDEAEPDEPDEPDQPADTSTDHPLTGKTLWQAIAHFVTSRQFWLITASLCCLTVMWDFLLMVPIFLSDTFQLTESEASVASSAFPFGSLISVLLGGYFFDALTRRQMAAVMGVLLLIATAAIGFFLLLPGLQLANDAAVTASAGVLFVFGLCVSPCYYIPMSVFSIQFGGPHSGFLVALLDAIEKTLIGM